MEDIKVIKICVIIITISIVAFVGYNIKVGMQLESTLGRLNSKVDTYEGYVESIKQKTKEYIDILDTYTKDTYGKSFIDEWNKVQDKAIDTQEDKETKYSRWNDECDKKCEDGKLLEDDEVDYEKCYRECFELKEYLDSLIK